MTVQTDQGQNDAVVAAFGVVSGGSFPVLSQTLSTEFRVNSSLNSAVVVLAGLVVDLAAGLGADKGKIAGIHEALLVHDQALAQVFR